MASIKLVHVTTVPQSLFFLRGQVGYMKDRGFDIHGLSSPGEFLSRFAEQERVVVHPVEMPRRITPIRDLAAVVRIWNVLRQVRPQIVHAHTPKGGVLGMVSAWLARIPVRIYHMRGLPFTTASGWKRALLIWSERISCRLADQVFCVSSSVRQVALENGLCPPDKIAVLARGSGNGVDAVRRFNGADLSPALRDETRGRYEIPCDALVLGFIGRIVRSKGIIELAGAWKRLRDEFPNLHLLLVGPYEAQDPISPEVDEELRRDARVHLIGEEWNTPPLYAAMDVLALPTYREGFPNVLLEAAGMKVPVVATSARLYGRSSGRRDREVGPTLRLRPTGGRRQRVPERPGTSSPTWNGGARLGAARVSPARHLAGHSSRIRALFARQGPSTGGRSGVREAG